MDRLLTLGHECDDEKSILRKKMLQLVDIYYDALKKGLQVNVPKELVPAKIPHYMGRGNFSTYNSKSVLGEIFDRADKLNLEEHCSIQVWKMPNFEDEISGARLHSWTDHYTTYRHEMHEACTLDGELKKEGATRVIHKYKQILYGADDLDKSSRSWGNIRLDALALYRVTYDYAIENKLASYCGFAWRVAGSALLKAFVDDQVEKPVTCVLSVLRKLVM